MNENFLGLEASQLNCIYMRGVTISTSYVSHTTRDEGGEGDLLHVCHVFCICKVIGAQCKQEESFKAQPENPFLKNTHFEAVPHPMRYPTIKTFLGPKTHPLHTDSIFKWSFLLVHTAVRRSFGPWKSGPLFFHRTLASDEPRSLMIRGLNSTLAWPHSAQPRFKALPIHIVHEEDFMVKPHII